MGLLHYRSKSVDRDRSSHVAAACIYATGHNGCVTRGCGAELPPGLARRSEVGTIGQERVRLFPTIPPHAIGIRRPKCRGTHAVLD
jgi:hypothetical protein